MDVYDTAAIALVWKRLLAKKDDDAAIVRDMLNMEENTEFHNGVMVLPVTLTKGLEFDAVVLWKPDTENYKNTPKDAKLLYVAITRSLHELHMILDNEISELLIKTESLN